MCEYVCVSANVYVFCVFESKQIKLLVSPPLFNPPLNLTIIGCP